MPAMLWAAVKCGDNVWYELNGTTLTISGTGPMKDYNNADSNPSAHSPFTSPYFKTFDTVVIEGNYSAIVI